MLKLFDKEEEYLVEVTTKKIDKKNIENILSLSPMQEGVLFHYLLNKKSNYYLEQLQIKVTGQLDIILFEKTWNIVAKNNEMLRTVFRWENFSNPIQVVLKSHNVNISLYDISEYVDIEGAANAIVEKDKNNIFILTEVPFRITLCKLRDNSHIILISNHHILYDGWSNGIILKEFFETYNALVNQKTVTPESKAKYRDYIRWLGKTDKDVQRKYWEDYLKNYESKAILEPSHSKNDSIEKEISVYTLDFPTQLINDVYNFTKSNDITLAALMYSAWGILLFQYCNEKDVAFGTTVSVRPDEISGISSIVGLCINTIPLRVMADANDVVLDVIKKINSSLLERKQYESTSLTDIIAYNGVSRDEELFQSIFVIENYPLNSSMFNEDNVLKVEKYAHFGKTNYDITVIAKTFDKNVSLEFQYNSLLFDKSIMGKMVKCYEKKIIEKLAEHFENIIGEIVKNPKKSIDDLEILTEEEKRKLLIEFNSTKAEYPKNKIIHELFEEQVEKTPDNIAVVYKDKELTYKELNGKANQLARVLREKGVGADKIVGIMLERSIEMIVGILGILKAGGAYLPIDPNYPESRIKYMLKDSGTNILLSIKEYITNDIYIGEVIELNDKTLYQGDNSNLEKVTNPDNLIYVMYTSGSTGKPKGVMIEHRSLVNRLKWMQKKYPLGEEDVILQKTPFTFDVSVWEMLWWGIEGAKVCFLVPEGEKDPTVIVDTISEKNITVMHFVPSMLTIFLKYLNIIKESSEIEKLVSLKQIFVSGEALTLFQENTFNKTLKQKNLTKLTNLYGPTETTIDVSYFDCLKGAEFDKIPIGKPIDNIKLFIIDKQNKMQPIGVAGELCITGDGLARGYLNKPELTKEKFIDNPFGEGKMYRTGDLARWLPDGNVEFLGRLDLQVKIRGNRIELGEIELKLLMNELVKEAVVVDREETNGDKYLCAYIVADEKLTVSYLREYLAKELPQYMIPSYFRQLEKIPLTANGKVDRKALPEHDSNINTGIEYVAPRNEKEEILVKVWSDVLKIENIGIKNNFFNLGGDSIKAIQVLSRLNGYGFKLEMKDLFKHPLIDELSGFVKSIDREIEQGIVEGEVRFTPIQNWLFEQDFEEKHHFNQAVMLYNEKGFKVNVLRKLFTRLVEHHDALRIVIRKGGVQYNRGLEEGELYSLEVKDLTNINDYQEVIEEEAARIQVGIDLNNGPLVKIGLFKTKEGDHLLIVIHHLVVDGISWRIIFEDLSRGYNQALNNEEIRFENKTDSFKFWSDKLTAYANSKELLREIEYWKRLEELKVKPLSKDNVMEIRKNSDSANARMELTIEDTEKLIKQVNGAYNSEINDILLTALGLTLKDWTGENKVLISLEGHGREEIIKEVDVSRTVGWFTSRYPIVLDMEGNDLSYQIKSIKEGIRQIPNKGVGYGILKYLTLLKSKGDLRFSLNPEISFNYLGQFDNGIDTGVFKASSIAIGEPVSRNFVGQYVIDINGMVVGGKLALNFTYNRNEYKKRTIEKIVDSYKRNLTDIINHCVNKEYTELTLSDFSSRKITARDVEEIYNILEERG